MQTSSTRKVAALLLAVLAVLVVGLVVAVKSVNLDSIKEVLTSQVQTATGRIVTIRGPLGMRLGLIPRVVADDVTLSNPPGSLRPDMVTIKHFEMEVALLPLLKREILINRLIVSGLDILLETEAQGSGNMNFGNLDKKSESKPTVAASGPGYRFNLHEVTVKDSLLAWHDRSTNKTESVDIQKVTVRPYQTSVDLLAIQLAAKVRGHKVDIDGTVGQLDTALEGKPWPMYLKTAADGMTITAEGAIAHLFAFRGLSLKLTVQGQELYEMVRLAGLEKLKTPQALGPFTVAAHLSDTAAGALNLTDVDAELGKRDFLLLNAKGSVKDLLGTMGMDLTLAMDSDNPSSLAQLAGTDMPPMGPMKLSCSVHGGGKAWKLADIKTSLAGSDLNGELALNFTGRPQISGTLSANTLRLDELTNPAVQPGQKSASQPARTKGGETRIFSNQPLPVHALRVLDADLTLQVGKLMTGNLQLSDIATGLHLHKGRLALQPFRAGLAGGTIEGEASLDATESMPVAGLHLIGHQVELGKLNHNGPISGGKTDLKLELKARGESVRALMASVTGETVVSVGKGRVQNKAVNWAGGDLMLQVLGSLNPMATHEDSTPLTCAAARFTIRDGIATTDKGLAARTDKVDIVGSGTVDLRSETLDLGIRPSARNGVGLSLSTPIAGVTRLRGTLANPSLGIDNEGTLRTAASMGAAAATGGLSLLGELLVDKVSSDSDPCKTALGQTSGKQKSRTQKQSKDGFFQGIFGR